MKFKIKTNPEIRQRMSDNDLHFWQVAEAVGVSENTLYRWFRHELDTVQLQTVTNAINALINTKG